MFEVFAGISMGIFLEMRWRPGSSCLSDEKGILLEYMLFITLVSNVVFHSSGGPGQGC